MPNLLASFLSKDNITQTVGQTFFKISKKFQKSLAFITTISTIVEQ